MEGATNTRPSSNQELEEEPFKNQENRSDSSDRNHIHCFDLYCNTCNQIVETGLKDIAEANQLHAKHAEQHGCKKYDCKQVPTNPVRQSVGYELLVDALKLCSEETKQEVIEKMKNVSEGEL